MHSYPARHGVPFLVDVRLLPDVVVIEADAPTLTKDDVKARASRSLTHAHADAAWQNPCCQPPM